MVSSTTVGNKRFFMKTNVILTFESIDEDGDRQEFFDIALPISKTEKDAKTFINNKLFKHIVKKCEKFNRNVEDLTKISTSSDWSSFEKATNLKSLPSLNHNCKWFFGTGRADLDEWEKALMAEYKFGINADMSWIGNPELTEQYMKKFIEKFI
jgi:hypothetical protein